MFYLIIGNDTVPFDTMNDVYRAQFLAFLAANEEYTEQEIINFEVMED